MPGPPFHICSTSLYQNNDFYDKRTRVKITTAILLPGSLGSPVGLCPFLCIPFMSYALLACEIRYTENKVSPKKRVNRKFKGSIGLFKGF